jgi:UDP-2-acetamido-2-deoxy-ribo-hexuluronate aminotransferase
VASIPSVIEDGVSVWAQYTIEHVERDKLAAHLKSKGIPTAVYYPLPLHLQSAYKECPRGAGGLTVTEAKAKSVISLPMHPYLEPDLQDYIIDAVRNFRL